MGSPLRAGPRPPPPPWRALRVQGRRKSVMHLHQSNVLYRVETADEATEKQWMAQLKRKRFEKYVHAQRGLRLQRERIARESEFQEQRTEREIERKLREIETLKRTKEAIQRDKIALVKRMSTQIGALKEMVDTLMMCRKSVCV